MTSDLFRTTSTTSRGDMVVQVKVKARDKDTNPTKQVMDITPTSQAVDSIQIRQAADSTTTQIRENIKLITANQNLQEIIVSNMGWKISIQLLAHKVSPIHCEFINLNI